MADEALVDPVTKPKVETSSDASGVSQSPMGSGLSNVVSQYGSSDAATVRSSIMQGKSLRAEADTERRTMMGVPVPKAPDLPKAPQTTPTDFMQMFGSAAMGLAGLGSLMTRRPLTNALNAGAAVMQAYHKNDMVAAQQAFQQWEAETKHATQLHQFEMEAFHAVMDKHKGNLGAIQGELTGLAAATKDDVVLAMLNRGDTQGAVNMYLGRGRLGGQMGAGQRKIIDAKQDFDEMQAARKAYKAAEAAGDQAGMEAASAQFEDVQQRSRDRAYAANPVASEREERLGTQKPADKMRELQLKATEELVAARESGDEAAIKAAQQHLADVNKPQKATTASGSLTPNRIIAQAATGYAEAERAKITASGGTVTPEQNAKIMMDSLQRAEREAPLAPAAQATIETKLGQVDRAGKLIRELQSELERRAGLSGITGQLRRGAENVSGLFGNDNVQANIFKKKLEDLQGLVGNAMSPASGRPLAADVKRMNDVLTNVGWGNNAALLRESLHAIADILYQQQQWDQGKLDRKITPDFPTTIKSLPPLGKRGSAQGKPSASSFDEFKPGTD